MSVRHEFVEKDGIRITYLDDNICFEDMETADAILIDNAGQVIHNNFDEQRTEYFLDYWHKIYDTIQTFRSLDAAEEVG